MNLSAPDARLDRSHRIMAMPNDALAAVQQLEIGMRAQEPREFGLHRLLDEILKAAKDFGRKAEERELRTW